MIKLHKVLVNQHFEPTLLHNQYQEYIDSVEIPEMTEEEFQAFKTYKTADKYIEQGFNDCMPKPIVEEELFYMLKRIIY